MPRRRTPAADSVPAAGGRSASAHRRRGLELRALDVLAQQVRAVGRYGPALDLAAAAAAGDAGWPGTRRPGLWATVTEARDGIGGGQTRSGGSSSQEQPDDPELRRVEALVTLAKQGDTEAFGQLYDRYVDAVYRYLYYRLGSAPLAEDLTSETFLRALRRLDSFTWQGKDIGAWFTTIARNLVTDHFKSSRVRLEVSTAEFFEADRVEDGVDEQVTAALEHAVLLDTVRELKAEQQECIVLRFLQGLSVAETAEVMGRSEGAVKQLQLRAVRALAQLLPRTVSRPGEAV